MRLTERSMLRIAEDLRADDRGAGDDVVSVEDHTDAVDHRRWVKERDTSGTTRLERVRFHVSWTGRWFRIPSLRGQS